jgi:hypothetical protein
MVYLESQDNCIIKDLNHAWIELESRIDSSPWGELADELFCDALIIQDTFGDSGELLRFLGESVKRVDEFQKSYCVASARDWKIREKLLSPSDRRRLNKINRANRSAAQKANARGEKDNFLVRAYLRKLPNNLVNHYNSRGLCRAHRHASRPTFSRGKDDDASDCSDPPGPFYPVTPSFSRAKSNNSLSPRRRPGTCRVPERGRAA